MNRLIETVRLRTQNVCKNWWFRKYSQFYAENFCLSKAVLVHLMRLNPGTAWSPVKLLWKIFALVCCFTSVNIYGQLNLTKLFPGQVNEYFVHILALVIDNNLSWIHGKMTGKIITWSISMKVWDRARIELPTPGSVGTQKNISMSTQSIF